jgi:hypothetical protein
VALGDGAETQPWGAAWRNKLQAVLGVCISVGVIGAALVMLVFYLSWSRDLADYRSAPPCTSPGDAVDSRVCRYSSNALVLSVVHDPFVDATVRFDAVLGRTFSTSFPKDREPSNLALVAGSTAPAVLWNGRITELAGEITVDSPQDKPIDQFGGLVAFFGLLGIAMLLACILMVRDAWLPKMRSD